MNAIPSRQLSGWWILWVTGLLVWVATAHCWAWIKVDMAGSLEGLALINERTKVCWACFQWVHAHAYLGLVYVVALIAVIRICERRGYGLGTRWYLVAVVSLPGLCYGVGMGYLGGKILA